MRTRYIKSTFAAIAALFLLAGCKTTSVGISSYENPAPSVAFSRYANFEVKPIEMKAPYAGQGANEKAKAKLEEELALRMDPNIAAWAARQADGGTLVIEPTIREIKFISGGSRFWAGAMAGDSAVVVSVIYRDKETGEVIANPEFYQHANAMGGAWSIGGTDNAMLNRMAGLITDFTVRNFDQAVGGPTGKPDPNKK